MDLITERTNTKSQWIDKKSVLEILEIMNEEDKLVAYAVEKELPNIAKAVEKIIECLKVGGRLIYIGAGTSGRLGILDASECPPTFSTERDQVIGIIAGGLEAVTVAIEGAEDNPVSGKQDLESIELTQKDVVVGISANGNTPYVLGAIEYSNFIGANTIGLACNKDSKVAKVAKIAITPVVGPEVITGSTRLKAGTAQKMVLNMLSTASMIGIGKVYNNLMVDLNPTNSKLMDRAKRIIMEVTGVEKKEAERYLEMSNNKPKIAIVMIKKGCSYEKAVELLEENDRYLYKVLE